MAFSAFWQRLDTPGHDAAVLRERRDGWLLQGCAVFLHGGLPAALDYALHLTPAWATREAAISGFVGTREIAHRFTRDPAGWRHNGAEVAGLAALVHLDLGFSPATNLAQLRQAALAVGAHAELPVAWFDVDAATLTLLPQRYERRSDRVYDYAAPSLGYRGLLEVDAAGFIVDYPGLWRRSPRTARPA